MEQPSVDPVVPTKFGEVKGDHIDIAHYAAMLNTWCTNRMELDKAILILSSGAIGLLITLSFTYLSVWGVLSGLAILAYTITIFKVLQVFGLNADYLEHEIMESKEDGSSLAKKLATIDKHIKFLFKTGVILSVLFALMTFLAEASILNMELTIWLKTK